MAEIQSSYLSGFKEVLLRIAGYQYPDQPLDSLSKTLEEVLEDWDEVESIGSLCIERAMDEKSLKQVEDLKNFGLASDFTKDFHIEDKPKYFQPPKPFVIDQSTNGLIRIYANRTFLQEALLAHKLVSLAAIKENPSGESLNRLGDVLTSKYYKKNPEQEAAIKKSLYNQLNIISGGPGTGKTETVARVLEAALFDHKDAVIYLAAPTGKARNRLSESIDSSLVKAPSLFKLCIDCKKNKCMQANTIHKWLYTNTTSGNKPNENNPLECDIMVIDEASMVGSELAFSIFNVIDPKRTKVILLGDMHQLKAVEPGNVYADISDPDGVLSDNLTELKYSHRFEKFEGIGLLASEINDPTDKDHSAAVWSVLEQEKDKGVISFYDKSSVQDKTVSDWIRGYIEKYADAVINNLCKEDVSVQDLKNVWEVFSSFRFIAAANQGAGGVQEINDLCEKILKEKLEIPEKEVTYCGKPIIISQNDQSIGVANGDDGVVYYSKEEDMWKAYIGDSINELPNGVPLSLLPSYDTAYAITIHKSQGSGFDDVGVFLPDNVSEDDPRINLATRELLYTAITRAKKHCSIFGPKEVLEKCVNTSTQRTGGLATRLKQFKRKLESSQNGSGQSAEQPTAAV